MSVCLSVCLSVFGAHDIHVHVMLEDLAANWQEAGRQKWTHSTQLLESNQLKYVTADFSSSLYPSTIYTIRQQLGQIRAK